jgi:abequosyltransferase
MNDMHQKYKISICIPTYNYGIFLKKNIDILIKEKYFDCCEVVIGDGGSTDDTEQLSLAYSKFYQNIKYYNFGKKSGIDIDLKKTSDLCNGEYIWFLSADDVPTKGCISRILNDISEQPACILYDRIICDYFLTVIKKTSWVDFKTHKKINFSNSTDYINYLDSLRSIGGLFSFMSVIVVNRSAWQNVTSGEVPKARNYQHVVRILRILQNPKHHLLVPCHYLINFRGDNDSFLNFGEFNRLMIDLKGYRRIISMYDEIKIIDKLKKMMRREQKWYYLPKFLVGIRGRNQILVIGYLVYFGYKWRQIMLAVIISRLSIFVKYLRIIRRAIIRLR